MKKLLEFLKFWLTVVPLWLPQRLFWKLRRRKCIKKGCEIETLKNKETQKIVYHFCSRCKAYKGKDTDESDYPLI